MRFSVMSSNQKGAVLLGALVTLMAVTALGSTLLLFSQFELKKTVSEKCMEEARYNSESASMSVSKLVRMVSERVDETGQMGIEAGSLLAPGISYPEATSETTPEAEFARKVLEVTFDPVCADVTLTPNGADMDSAADIQPDGSTATIGTAANIQAAGYSYGVGLGAAGGGGTSQWFIIAGLGRGGMQDCRHISYSRYRRVLGVAGGM